MVDHILLLPTFRLSNSDWGYHLFTNTILVDSCYYSMLLLAAIKELRDKSWRNSQIKVNDVRSLLTVASRCTNYGA